MNFDKLQALGIVRDKIRKADLLPYLNVCTIKVQMRLDMLYNCVDDILVVNMFCNAIAAQRLEYDEET